MFPAFLSGSPVLDAMRWEIEVVVWRGAIREARHRVQAVVVDSRGAIAARTGEPHLATTIRSAAKPFQLLPLVERGHADRWGWSDEQIAVMAGSHTGSAYHVHLVSGILDRIGVPDRMLACGFHEPLDPESRDRLKHRREPGSALYNNCSGKHAGMLCLALSEGWPLEGYERADHPVQQLIRHTIAEVFEVSAVAVAVDGCSVSVFGLPLSSMAKAYAVLGASSGNGDARSRAFHRIRTAMGSFPRAVGGAGRLSTALMEETAGRLVAKGGAEALECVALPERRLGLAVKCEDGGERAVGPAVLGLLERLGELSPAELERLVEWRRPILRNHAGLEVGRIEAMVATVT